VNPTSWPYPFNSETLRKYEPHHDHELEWVEDRSKRYLLAKGGEGGGKTVAGIVRVLDRLKAGCHGIMVSPDFEHFKKSLWPEFRRWCPWEFVTSKQRYRKRLDWEPGRPFQLVFTTGGVIYCGGIKENDVMSWEGPNVNFAHFDEPRRHNTPAALKVLDGRVRIPMGGYKPQIWLTTTPRKHWLYNYFGPWDNIGTDPLQSFKDDTHVITLLTSDNEINLEPGFVAKRRQSLTEAEARVLLDAEWEDIESTDSFLPSITLWDLCLDKSIRINKHSPMVVAIDAPEGSNLYGHASSFGMVGCTRHSGSGDVISIPFVRKWDVPKNDVVPTEISPGLAFAPSTKSFIVTIPRDFSRPARPALITKRIFWFSFRI